MPDMAIGFDMQQLRPAAAPYLFHQIAGQNIQPKRVIPIERLRRKAETLGARDRTVAPRQLIGARGRRVFIVLANKKNRQVENAGPIQTFQEGPPVDRAVAEETDHNIIFTQHLLRLCRAHGDQDTGADDTVRAQHADIEIGDVHGAALATANPAFLAEELTHHRFGIGAFGDGVAVATVVARDLVAPAQVTANTRRDRFLSNGEMRRALHQIFFGTADHHTFESTDTAHRGIKVEDALRRGGLLG